MEPQAAPEFVIGQMRVLTMSEETFFYVANKPTVLADLDKDLNILMPKLGAAQAQAHIAEAGPVVIRYFKVAADGHAGQPDLFLMEVGFPVKPGTQLAGEAQVKTLPPFHCAGLLYWGSLMYIEQAYGTLRQAIKEAGLEPTDEGREWHYHFEGDASPHNILGLYLAIR